MKNWFALMTGAVSLLFGALILVSCSELKEDLPSPVSAKLIVHEAGWNDTSASNFHGIYLRSKQWQLSGCASCHSASFTGGASRRSCFDCHALYPHQVNYGTLVGHPADMRKNHYPFGQCQICHGGGYAGGSVVNVSCMQSGCHVDAAGNLKSPEACNTCHGRFNGFAGDTLSAAPPRGIDYPITGDTSTTVTGIGAHQKHLLTGTLGTPLKCQECHTVPTSVSTPGHITPSMRATVAFNGPLAGLVTANGTFTPSPSYDPGTLKCSNTYCHGSWRRNKSDSQFPYEFVGTAMIGYNASPMWTGGLSEVACGSCHGTPPEGHNPEPISKCGDCHEGVVDANGKIIDKTKHMNGKIDVFGQQFDF